MEICKEPHETPQSPQGNAADMLCVHSFAFGASRVSLWWHFPITLQGNRCVCVDQHYISRTYTIPGTEQLHLISNIALLDLVRMYWLLNNALGIPPKLFEGHVIKFSEIKCNCKITRGWCVTHSQKFHQGKGTLVSPGEPWGESEAPVSAIVSVTAAHMPFLAPWLPHLWCEGVNWMAC